mmetsp:Transcript_17400/g.30012  ORF Transcript_17400/g.30012 Transcript_17400/m.30012 type:complete len:161 (+) Transcript_17400:1-483(+)
MSSRASLVSKPCFSYHRQHANSSCRDHSMIAMNTATDSSSIAKTMSVLEKTLNTIHLSPPLLANRVLYLGMEDSSQSTESTGRKFATKTNVTFHQRFGASSYHWRHNIPVLARNYHVYALDLLGFGWSDKPIMHYDASIWRDQTVDFVKEIILKGNEDEQ